MSESYIDLRSDTVTEPTDKMREAMRAARVGDDGRGEDPTVNRLQELAAHKLGKEAALLLPSGTMANLVALMTHCTRGQEVILEARAHIYWYEVGGVSAVAGLIPRLVPGHRGILDSADVERAIRPSIPHFPKTGLICLENSHNLAGGVAVPPRDASAVYAVALRNGLRVHLDGARIFNAAVALGVDPREFAAHADSVMFCLSKGLSAPVGSVLCGDRDFIGRARINRLLLGGAMRQAGVFAAAGIVALEEMIDRLAEDHANARRLANGLSGLEHVSVDLDSVQTNIVMIELAPQLSAPDVVGRLARQRIRCLAEGAAHLRFVTHRHISPSDVDHCTDVMSEVLSTAPH